MMKKVLVFIVFGLFLFAVSDVAKAEQVQKGTWCDKVYTVNGVLNCYCEQKTPASDNYWTTQAECYEASCKRFLSPGSSPGSTSNSNKIIKFGGKKPTMQVTLPQPKVSVKKAPQTGKKIN